MADQLTSETLNKGPLGLGDPNDTTLRKVEVEVLIPKLMRDKAKKEHCSDEVNDFTECCQNNKILMVINCRKQNSSLKDCLGKWYQNKEFVEECTKEYLRERSDYRRTGLVKKYRDFIKNNRESELKS